MRATLSAPTTSPTGARRSCRTSGSPPVARGERPIRESRSASTSASAITRPGARRSDRAASAHAFVNPVVAVLLDCSIRRRAAQRARRHRDRAHHRIGRRDPLGVASRLCRRTTLDDDRACAGRDEQDTWNERNARRGSSREDHHLGALAAVPASVSRHFGAAGRESTRPRLSCRQHSSWTTLSASLPGDTVARFA